VLSRQVISRPNPNTKNEFIRILLESDLKHPLVTMGMDASRRPKSVGPVGRSHLPKTTARKARQGHFIMFYLNLDLVGRCISLIFDVKAKSVKLPWIWVE